MIRALVVDDEPMARAKLRRLLQAAGVEVVAEAGEAEAALVALAEHQVDVLFLDIDLPGRSGLELARSLARTERPWIVFATAYDAYALEAFAVEALDYLLKPFDAERVARVLERVRAQPRTPLVPSPEAMQAMVSRLEELQAAARTPVWASRLVVQHGRELRMLRAEAIDWIGSADNYVELHVGRETHLMRDTLQAVGARLDPDRFARIHRQTIVNLDRVATMRLLESGPLEVVLTDGTVLAVGRAYRADLTQRWRGGGGATG